MLGHDLHWKFFSSLILLVTGVMGVLVLVTAVIVDSKDDHGRDQSKPCTFEIFRKFLFYTLTLHIPNTYPTRPQHLNNNNNLEKGSKR